MTTPVPRKYKRMLLLSIPVLAILVGVIVYAYEYSSSQQFCGTACHIMEPYYETVLHNVHREENNVKCKDCHIPHDNLAHQVVFKGYSGARDIYHNTFNPPVVIHTTDWTKSILQKNCLRCHQTVVERVDMTDGKLCFECHRDIPHDQSPQSFGTTIITTSK